MRRAVLPLLAAAVLAAAGCGSGTSSAPPSGTSTTPSARPTAAAAKRALASRFTDKSLSTHSITCIDEGVTHGAEAVIRCNVNFGEPHIEGYCVIVRGGHAITQFEDPSIRCNRTRTGDEP